jgi:hypothetical protein
LHGAIRWTPIDSSISNGGDAMALADYFLHHRDVIPVSPAGRVTKRSRVGSVRRLLDALVVWQLRQTEHEITRYLESTGGKLTDAVEREIAERLSRRRSSRTFVKYLACDTDLVHQFQ